MTPEYPVVAIPIAVLKSHPRQLEFFSDTSECELEELARDLGERGQQEPIHVSPDYTILRGHRRVRAASLLEWETIRAVVRYDIPDVNSPEAVMDLICDNVMRRQCDELELARCYREMKATHDPESDDLSGDIRDRLAARLRTGKSGRTLDRLERLLQLPRDIQDMISRNTLNKHQGEKILKLPHSKREALIAELQSSQPVPDVLRRYGVITSTSRKSLTQVGEELLRFFRTHLQALRDEIASLDSVQIPDIDAVQLLDEASRVLKTWAKRKRSLRRKSAALLNVALSELHQPDKLSN